MRRRMDVTVRVPRPHPSRRDCPNPAPFRLTHVGGIAPIPPDRIPPRSSAPRSRDRGANHRAFPRGRRDWGNPAYYVRDGCGSLHPGL